MQEERQLIDAFFVSIRSAIRRHVILDGSAVLIGWLIVAFWTGLALDYLPIWLGLIELPRVGRVILLVITIGGGIWIAYWMIFRRLFFPITDTDLALLVERKVAGIDSNLVTSVQVYGKESQADPQLLAATLHKAKQAISGLSPTQFLDQNRLRKRIVWSLIAILTIVIFAVVNHQGLELASARLFGLSNRLWPRSVWLVWNGSRIRHDQSREGIPEFLQTIVPHKGAIRVPRGSSLTLQIESLNLSPAGRPIAFAENCWFDFRSSDGARGRQLLKKIGTPREGRQLFLLDGPPLDSLTQPIHFSISANDLILSGLRIEVVNPPTLAKSELACVFPQYLQDPDSGRWTNRSIEWTPGLELPIGTSIQWRLVSDRPLKRVYFSPSHEGSVEIMEVEGHDCVVELPTLQQLLTRYAYLVDTEGILNSDPFQMSVRPVVDQPPKVIATLNGIGTAITPQAKIPFECTVTDDYEMRRAWVLFQATGKEPKTIEFTVGKAGKASPVVDFRELAQKEGWVLPTQPGSQLTISLQADDHYDLTSESHLGQSGIFQLDIVEPNQLVRMLERSEAAERRRLEQISLELGEALEILRHALVDTENTTLSTDSSEPPPASESGTITDSADKVKQRFEVRLLYAQRAAVQLEKSAQEISGAARTFEQIRWQLLNNRLDAQDRDQRLKVSIVAPLADVSSKLLEYSRKNTQAAQVGLREALKSGDLAASETAKASLTLARKSCEEQLIRLNQIIAILLKFETQNELLDLVRNMMEQQESILKKTRQERQKKAFDGLLDDSHETP